MEFDTYYLCFLKRGPVWTGEPSPELKERQAAHVAYLGELRQSGKTLVSGPTPESGDLRGISIYKTTTVEEARALAEDDPHVQAGHLVIELHPWYVLKGALEDAKD